MRGFRALAFGLGFTASIIGTFQGAAAAGGLISIDACGPPPTVLLCGSGALGYGPNVNINCISGDEIRMLPQDTRGHARSFSSPRREPKGMYKVRLGDVAAATSP
jgi:hypothetical protein